MAEEKKNWLGPYIPQGNFLREFVQQAKLIYHLMLDRRVHPLSKVLPIAAVAYLISPIDLIPDILFPVIGEVDDIVVMYIGFRLFIELAPPEVVHEYLQQLVPKLTSKVEGDWNVVDKTPPPPPDSPPPSEGDVIEGTYRIEDDKH